MGAARWGRGEEQGSHQTDDLKPQRPTSPGMAVDPANRDMYSRMAGPLTPLLLGRTLNSLYDLEATLQNHSTHFDKVLQAIMDSKIYLDARIDTVSLDVNLLRADHCKLTDKVDDAESTLVLETPTVQDLQVRLKHMEEVA
ncbi:hypothetical protein NDU88_007328 [Pleurodeles waltl]|uniref:Uncharacterized protein n=1 Tax=Pleurodeles waltl TaxID=8319 RepID=A0AAV7UQQ0_PLEWA|nr:hypothetical protein NDU88_007328 [Pleurodeles waltl]